MKDFLSLRKITKEYKNTRAVDSVSFDVPKGSMFGLLGPNGAGKTSIIRMITGITGPDSGEIYLDGELISERKPNVIGYLPEERGLYKKMKVGEHLLYLMHLRGMKTKVAKATIKEWMDRLEIVGWWNKKVQELSKGMQQKIQFIATVAHNPKLLILDEPFSGLDPVNTGLIKAEIDRLRRDGTTVLLSTHRMEQVEEFCDRIVLINNGANILSGEVEAIKQSYKENKFRVVFKGNLPEINWNGTRVIQAEEESIILQVEDERDSNQALKRIIETGVYITSFQEILPNINEIFIKSVTEQLS